jgi:hypothetical protein
MTNKNCITALSRLGHDAPPGLRYWLRNNSPSRTWLDAPRPDWLVYLMSKNGYATPLILRARYEIELANANAEAKRHVNPKDTDRPTPNVDACDRINRVIAERN